MSDKMKYLAGAATAMVIFVLVAWIADRDDLRYLIRSSDSSREREEVQATINHFNAIFSDFYASNGVPALLNEFPASKSVRHWLFRDIGFVRDSGRVLVYDLANITPVSITVRSPFSAEAVVLEEWNYMYQRARDRYPLSRVKGMGLGFRYLLSRQRGRWIVVGWDPVDVEKSPDKEFRF